MVSLTMMCYKYYIVWFRAYRWSNLLVSFSIKFELKAGFVLIPHTTWFPTAFAMQHQELAKASAFPFLLPDATHCFHSYRLHEFKLRLTNFFWSSSCSTCDCLFCTAESTIFLPSLLSLMAVGNISSICWTISVIPYLAASNMGVSVFAIADVSLLSSLKSKGSFLGICSTISVIPLLAVFALVSIFAVSSVSPFPGSKISIRVMKEKEAKRVAWSKKAKLRRLKKSWFENKEMTKRQFCSCSTALYSCMRLVAFDSITCTV